MGTREYDFIPGIETGTSPTPSTPSGANDVISKGYADVKYGGAAINHSGTRASPINVTAVGGVTPVAGTYDQVIFVQGSGGAVTVTANPQIVAGTVVGQRLQLIGRSDTNTLTLSDGTGLDLNGAVTLAAGMSLKLLWDGTNWMEDGTSAR